jgi:3D (Asp-Asp-Asp) domain-containing protein
VTRFQIVGGTALLALIYFGFPSRSDVRRETPVSVPSGAVYSNLLVTAYCNCGTCCSWKRSWFGFGPPVYTSGRLKGRRKKIGITASGTRARRGTVAADTRLFPFGTELEIPGYGKGVVEDTGGAIKGSHLDLWFPSHEQAKKWGRKRLMVRVIRRGRKSE